jgi:nitrogen regulatory protein PII
MTTNNHEVIFAIVNSGFAEVAMEVARDNGARGGTILNARGVAREETAAFFGITLHAEKEILMMVVEKSIRDNVLNALYKEMGMAKKAQGIAFSLPVSDVAGLAPLVELKEATE